MVGQANTTSKASDLRMQAESRLSARIHPNESTMQDWPLEAKRLLHELQVHQIELEMQKEELQSTQVALEASRARYVQLYDEAPIGYATLSESGAILECNLRMATLLGIERSALVGRPITDFLGRDAQDTFYLHRRWMQRDGSPQSFELGMKRRDGSPFWAQLEMAVADLPGELRQGARLVVSDLSLRKQAEEERNQLATKLQRTQKMESLGLLAGGVAHDMNNVLAAILGLASANLLGQPEGSPVHRAFETILKAAERGGKVVRSLLQVARESPLDLQELDLNALLQDELPLFERLAPPQIRFQLDLEAPLPPIQGDPSTLAHVLMNLCINAIDATQGPGTITLATRDLGPMGVQLRVADTGCGMAPEVLARCTDPFFTTKPQGKGTGLGLTMAYNAMKAHRGEFQIQSIPGQGTQVILNFPTHEPGPRTLEVDGQDQPASSRARLEVLVVDDDELVQDSMAFLLEALGHTFTTLGSGEEALERLQLGPRPDLLILDMNMPGLGGPETLKRLRTLDPTLPVLVSTGRADQAVQELVAGSPRTALLAKPFTLQTLGAQLEALTRP